MQKRPKSRQEENRDASKLTEHEQMIRALQEAAERLSKARQALKKQDRSTGADDDHNANREW